MEEVTITPRVLAEYMTLRLAGYPPARAARDVRSTVATQRLEMSFLGQARGVGESAMLPKYARDESHANAILRLGGYPVCVKHG